MTLENFTYGDTPTAEAVSGLLRDVLGRGPTFDVSLYDLSGDHDIRPLVAQTLLTYLELEGVIEATGPFYAEYKVQTLRPLDAILGRFDARRADFLRRLFALGRKGPKWLTIDTLAAARRPGRAPRADREGAELPGGTGRGRAPGRRAPPGVPPRRGPGRPRAGLVALLASRFLDREARDVARVRQVLDYAREPSCLTRRLLAYFGEDLPAPCGHCARCLGHAVAALPAAPERPLGPRERALVGSIRAENHRALSGPRPLARFLTGLSSPATTRAKLTRHPSFGALDDVPFARVVAFVGG